MAHTRSPAESNFDTNTSSPTVLPFVVRLVVPAPGSKSPVPWNHPVVYTLPDESTATEVPKSILVPPKDLAHTRSPAESNFDTNTSSLSAEERLTVPAPGSKSTVPSKSPVVYTLPDESTTTEFPCPELAPPNCLAHT